MVQPVSACHQPQILTRAAECCSLTETSSKLAYRICPQMQFSHVLVGAAAQPDMVRLLLQLMGRYYGLTHPCTLPSLSFCVCQ